MTVSTGMYGAYPNLPCLNEKHLAKFQEHHDAPPSSPVGGGKEGLSPAKWYAGVAGAIDADLGRFGEGLNRTELIEYQTNRSISTLSLCIAILAWGGMRPANRNRLFRESSEPWVGTAQRIRDGSLTRSEAFDAFASLRRRDLMPGMGPAYFTKLIYFLMPRLPGRPVGYIMDQWLGCSINMLFDSELVLLDHHVTWSRDERAKGERNPESSVVSTVSTCNDGERYELFCTAVEHLSNCLGSGPIILL